MNLIQAIRELPLTQAIEAYVHRCHFPFEPFQAEDWAFVEAETKCCICRSRGGSKTRDFSNWLVFHVLRTQEQWAWLACKSGQLEQCLAYLRQNPFVAAIKRISSAKYDVILHTHSTLRCGIISTSNLGRRFDGIVFDEFEDLEPKQEAEIYPQMEGMMSASEVHKAVYLGTLWINTKFNEFCETYPTVVRSWETLPWLVNAGFVQAEIDAKVVPEWEIDLLYRCIPTVPGGAVFQNLEERELDPSLKAEQYGIDFGGTDVCVGLLIKEDEVLALEEYAVQLEQHNEALDFLKGQRVEAEGIGYNDSDRFAAKCNMMVQRINAHRVPITFKYKSERQMLARSFKVVVDKRRTPNLYKDLKGATFGPDGLYLKDAQHPCHYLDAFFHALGAVVKRVIPTKHANEVLRREKERR